MCVCVGMGLGVKTGISHKTCVCVGMGLGVKTGISHKTCVCVQNLSQGLKLEDKKK